MTDIATASGTDVTLCLTVLNLIVTVRFNGLKAFGNFVLLEQEKVGFLASRRVPPETVMRCLDWATRMRDEGVCVMSGFQSPLEKEVLNILLKGTSPLILVLARRMWDERHIPTLFRKPLAEGRLLVVSPVSQSIRRVDARSAALRKTDRVELGGTILRRMILTFCDSPYLTPENYEETLHQLADAFTTSKARPRIGWETTPCCGI